MANALLQPFQVPSLARARQSALTARGMETQNALARQRLQALPEERAWTKEKRQMEREDFEYTKHFRKFKTSLEPLVKLKALDEMMRLVANKTTLSNHDAVTANISQQLGIDPNQAQQEPTAAQIAQQAQAAGQDPETYYQQVYKPQSLMKWDQQFELMKLQITEAGKETPEEKLARDKELATHKQKIKPPKEATPRKVGETRKFQKGTETITQEWTGKAWKEIGKGPKFKETKKKDNLKELSKNYFQAIGRANSAQLKVGQFVQDPNSEAVAQQEYERAKALLDQYTKAGGNPADLGIGEQPAIGAGEMPEMPDPKAHKGRIIRDTLTGKRYESDGTTWSEI